MVKTKKEKHLIRHPNRNRHHLIPKSRLRKRGRKDDSVNNLLLIEIERHVAWHKLFDTRTLDEVIKLLQRVKRAKKAQKERR